MAQQPVPQEQNFQNHGRTDPAFHGFLFIGGLLLLAGTIYQLVQHFDWWGVGRVFAVIWAMVLMFKTRLYALKVQDRVIRLEERLRLTQLLPETLRARIPELSEKQLVALRFASDGEVPGLVEKTLAGNLDSKQIKQSIERWRPDFFRV